VDDLVPVEKKRVSEEVVSQLQRLIYIGRCKPGDRLPREKELCQALNVSKTSLREGLYVLQTMGYIEIKPRNGIYVKSPIPNTMPQPVMRMFKLGPEQLLDILETLEVLGTKVASLAAERAIPQDVAEMQEVIGKFRKHLDTGKVYSSISGRSYNMQIYSLCAQACKNPLLAHLTNFAIEFIKGPLPFDVEQLDALPGFAETICKQLEEIVFSIRDRRPTRAQEAAHKHLSYIEERLRELIDENRINA